MKNKAIILSLILSIFVTSCSTRKVSKTEVKETTEVKAIDTTKTVTNTETTVKSLDTSTINEIEIVPIDITKPITVNGKTYLNAVLRLKTTKVNKVVEIETKVAQIESKGVSNEVKQVTQTNVKQTERKGMSFWDWFWIAVCLVCAYFIYKKLR